MLLASTCEAITRVLISCEALTSTFIPRAKKGGSERLRSSVARTRTRTNSAKTADETLSAVTSKVRAQLAFFALVAPD